MAGSDSSKTSILIVTTVLLGLSLITVVLRFYARRRQKASLEWKGFEFA